MRPKTTTLGQLMINQALPEELRDYNRVYTKSSLRELMRGMAKALPPDEFRETVHKLSQIGLDVSSSSPKASFSLQDLMPSKSKKKVVDDLRRKTRSILKGTPDRAKRNEKILSLLSEKADDLKNMVYQEALENNNPFALQVLSGSRGNPGNINSLIGADLMYQDYANRPIATPILNSYSEGLDPVEYWAGAYGARAGTIATKFATQNAGFLAKQLNLASHRLVASDEEPNPDTAIPVDIGDPDNIGSVLARDYGDIPAGTPITAKVAKQLEQNKDLDQILVYSPINSIASDGSVPRLAAGVREYGTIARVGDNIGLSASSAISEPISQGVLNTKHGGGVAKGVKRGPDMPTGFDFINQLVQAPKTFKAGAAMASVDGVVTKIEDAPQGGKFIYVGDERAYALEGFEPSVKVGDKVEAGDALSEGIVNPAELVRHKGIGEARLLFTKQLLQALRDSNLTANRRNVEIVSRGLMNNVILDREDILPGHLPGDTVTYDYFASRYEPRQDSEDLAPHKAIGRYLERPALNYSIGTRITPRVADRLKKFDFGSVHTHQDNPGFEPVMVRAMESLKSDEDWLTQLGGFYLQRNFLENAQRGASSNLHGTSFIPALSSGEIGKSPTGVY